MIFNRKHRKHTQNPPLTPADRALNRILLKCDYRLDRVVEYILAATQEDVVCNYCVHKADGDCGGLTGCAAAVTAYLKERDGHE